MKLLTIIGARPQFVKAAALSRELAKHPQITEIIIHTGQHFDQKMSEVFFTEMQIPQPKYNLNVHGVSHGAMTGRMLEGIEEVIIKEKADMVLVYGDTNSTIAGALAAKKLHVKVAHVEAGLRSFNMEMPEEINRILTDRISDILFCPTNTAVENLKKEGFDNFGCQIIKSGDVMQDAALHYARFSAEKSQVIADHQLEKGFILCTIHRAENTNNVSRLKSIIEAVNEIGSKKQIVLPLHPRTRQVIRENNLQLRVKAIDPVGYFDMIELLKNCSLVMTDSGGLQKEAFFFQRPCVTIRDQTEWTELVINGFNVLAGANKEKIISATNTMINAELNFNVDLYGNGTACNKIAESLINSLNH